MFTVREEIIKWMINEGHIKSSKDVKKLNYKNLLKKYFDLINIEPTTIH